jgi:protein-tyrosine-phosphatase
LFRVLADPRRWELLRVLAQSDRRVGELTALVDQPQNLVSYHLGELRAVGLVTARRSSFDGRDVYYRAQLAHCGDLLRSAGAALHPGVALAPEPPPAGPGRPRSARPRVLFLCTGNSARSQIAEALLAHRSQGTIEARSAGSHPKALHDGAVRAMAERGIDISTNRTKPLDRFRRSRFDHVITLCDKVREVCPEFPGQPVTAHWSVADPASVCGHEQPGAFDQVVVDLEERVGQLIALIRATTGGHRRAG